MKFCRHSCSATSASEGTGSGLRSRSDRALRGLVQSPTGGRRPTGEVEQGYRLRRSALGKGYATEGARALIRAGFEELGASGIVASTMVVNMGSRRVIRTGSRRPATSAGTRSSWMSLRGHCRGLPGLSRGRSGRPYARARGAAMRVLCERPGTPALPRGSSRRGRVLQPRPIGELPSRSAHRLTKRGALEGPWTYRSAVNSISSRAGQR
jgi:hypothetical protein